MADDAYDPFADSDYVEVSSADQAEPAASRSLPDVPDAKRHKLDAAGAVAASAAPTAAAAASTAAATAAVAASAAAAAAVAPNAAASGVASAVAAAAAGGADDRLTAVLIANAGTALCCTPPTLVGAFNRSGGSSTPPLPLW